MAWSASMRPMNSTHQLPKQLTNNSHNSTGTQSFVERQLELPLAEWASEGKQLRVAFYHPAGPKKSPWPIIQIYFFDPAPPKDIDYGDVDFETEIEWGQTTQEELLEAKARAEQTEGKTVNNPAPKMPVLPCCPPSPRIDCMRGLLT